jgi:hypothetical protein
MIDSRRRETPGVKRVSIGLFLVLLTAVALLGLLVSYAPRRRRSSTVKELSSDDLRKRKLHNQYDRRVDKGEPSRLLARVYSQMDMALILSILSSRNIVGRTVFGITNNLRNGLGIQGYNDTWLVVLNNDYDRAREIVRDYTRRRKRTSGNVRGKTRLRNAIEALLFRWAVNGDYRLPDMTSETDTEYGSRARRGRFRRNP